MKIWLTIVTVQLAAFGIYYFALRDDPGIPHVTISYIKGQKCWTLHGQNGGGDATVCGEGSTACGGGGGDGQPGECIKIFNGEAMRVIQPERIFR